MASVSNTSKGARLEFVLRPYKGKRERKTYVFDPKLKKNVEKIRKEEGGYILYNPDGQAYYLSKEEAMKRGFLNRKPRVLNLDQVQDTSTAAGEFKFAVRQQEREAAYMRMEQEIINLCSKKGHIIPAEEYDRRNAAFEKELSDANATA